MGFLMEPCRKKTSFCGKARGFIYGQTCMQGWRDAMEDEHLTIPKLLESPEIAVFGVFDGHGGSLIAETVAKELVRNIVETSEFKSFNDQKKSPTTLAKAMCQGFLQTDQYIRNLPHIKDQAEETGSTAALVFITRTHLISANVGDTRCIVSLKGNSDALPLSIDHKPNQVHERDRIVAAGGSIIRNRVCGGVAVSRSFGDYWFKRKSELKDYEQQVSAEPHVQIHQRSEMDEFLVLACDGIFDVLSNEQVQQFVRNQISNGLHKKPQLICELLVDECLKLGSRDNMSVTLVIFAGARGLVKRKTSCIVQ